MGGKSVSSQNHAVMDFDGDGILDAIAHPRPGSTSNNYYWWFVWPGDGTGGFGPKRYVFPTRDYEIIGPIGQRFVANGVSGAAVYSNWPDVEASSTSTAGLSDINGDGLPDHWLYPAVSGIVPVNVSLNDGTSHRLIGTAGHPCPYAGPHP